MDTVGGRIGFSPVVTADSTCPGRWGPTMAAMGTHIAIIRDRMHVKLLCYGCCAGGVAANADVDWPEAFRLIIEDLFLPHVPKESDTDAVGLGNCDAKVDRPVLIQIIEAVSCNHRHSASMVRLSARRARNTTVDIAITPYHGKFGRDHY